MMGMMRYWQVKQIRPGPKMSISSRKVYLFYHCFPEKRPFLHCQIYQHSGTEYTECLFKKVHDGRSVRHVFFINRFQTDAATATNFIIWTSPGYDPIIRGFWTTKRFSWWKRAHPDIPVQRAQFPGGCSTWHAGTHRTLWTSCVQDFLCFCTTFLIH